MMFLVELQYGNNACLYDPLLAVECHSLLLDEPDKSFCVYSPSLRPLGNGAYEVQIVIGTIW